MFEPGNVIQTTIKGRTAIANIRKLIVMLAAFIAINQPFARHPTFNLKGFTIGGQWLAINNHLRICQHNKLH